MERDNDSLINQLHGKVQLLKDITLELGEEARASNRELDEMDNDFSRAQAKMKTTLTKLANMIASGGSKHMCYLVLFIFAIFLFVWWLVR